MERFDHAIIGGGIIGLATAAEIVRRQPDAAVVLLEKEAALGLHQTGHNSGVIHSGIYYRPGSLKARLCVEGRRRLIEWCENHGVDTRISGKLVVATTEDELGPLAEIRRRAEANGVAGVEHVDGEALREYEPHVAGVAGLWVPGTGAVDFGTVAARLGAQLRTQGVDVRTNRTVVAAERNEDAVELRTAEGDALHAARVVACAGLQSDLVARRLGLSSPVRIVPFRGEYWMLRRPELVRSMIYPVPDPRFPFLGLHFTRRIDGTVEAGPNAVLALAREGYSWRDMDRTHLREIAGFSGLRSLARRYWRTGAMEMARSLVPRLLLRDARRLIPDVAPGDLVRAGAGVRAQAVTDDGALIDDFVIEDDGIVAAVLNAPSPAATASFAIADEIVNGLAEG